MPRAKSPRNGSRKVTEMSIVTPISTENSVSADGNGHAADLETEIRRRAYELYQQRGCQPGHEIEDWFSAEREVMAKLQQIA